MGISLSEDGYKEGKIAGLSGVRPKQGSEAELVGFDAGYHAASQLTNNRFKELRNQQVRPRREWWSPVGEPDKIDLIGVTQEGRVEVTMVTGRRLDPEEQQAVTYFEAKFRNYCQYIKTSEFAKKFGPPSRDRVWLQLRSDWEVPDKYIQIMNQIGGEENVPAKLVIRYQ